MRLRRLTDKGIERMARFIESYKTGTPEALPKILCDDMYSEDLASRIVIDPHPRFRRRLELAGYIHHVLSEANAPDPRQDKGLWAWWALAWFDDLTQNGKTSPGDIARWIPQLDKATRYYRHLLLNPYLIYRLFAPSPERALALLAQPPHKPGDIVEQIASRPALVTSTGIVELATQLYVDSRGAIKPRAPGNARRFADVLSQLGLTFDLHSLNADEIGSLLPSEFNQFRS